LRTGKESISNSRHQKAKSAVGATSFRFTNLSIYDI
jgi:hypothetical protein